MKTTFTIISFLFLTSVCAQSNIDGTEYVEHAIYIQIDKQYFNQHDQDHFANLDAIHTLIQNGQIASTEVAFEQLAKRNEVFSRIFVLGLSNEVDEDHVVASLSGLPYIELIERIPAYQHELIPNDPDYGTATKRWHLDQVGAEAAWDITTGCADVTIAIVDDAVRLTHEDLASKIYTNPNEIAGNGIDDDNNGYIDDVNGWDVADNDNDPNVPNTATNSHFTHGTHVAGIAGAASNNGIGTASLGYNTMIVPVKSKSDNNGSPSGLNNPMNGVEYAIALGVDVINMSWGSYAYSAVNQLVFNQAFSEGIVCVAATGNDGLSFISYPAAYNHVIAVGATNQANDLAPFTNLDTQGDVVTVFAPGVDIWSCTAGSDSGYDYFSGTSMSTPLVSGLVGLMICNDTIMQPSSIASCLHNAASFYPSTAFPGFTIRIANAVQSLNCTTPLANTCEPNSCELISNGSLETPADDNIIVYDWDGTMNLGEVCSWIGYHGTVDCLPADHQGVNNYCHVLNYAYDDYYEGLVSNKMDLITGKTYQVEFDYAVARSQWMADNDNLDSLITSLFYNDYVYDMWNFDSVYPTIMLDAVLDISEDFTYSSIPNLVNGVENPNAYWHHHSFTFVAPADTSLRRLVIYPHGHVGSYERRVFLDNVSVRPVVEVQAFATDTIVMDTYCTDLGATGVADEYVWEPSDEFANPVGQNQTVCPTDTITYIVTAYDDLLGCSASDSVTVIVIPYDGLNELNPNISISAYPNPFTDQLQISLKGYTDDLEISIHDISGRMVFQESQTANSIVTLNLKSLIPGVYDLWINDFASIKIIKL